MGAGSRPECDSARRAVRLVAFDVDGTLVEHPEAKVVWQLLNERVHTDPGVNRRRQEAYRRGEISYEEWVGLDISDWRAAGLDRDAIVSVLRASLRPVDGALETLAELERRGYRRVLISGTLDLTVETVLAGARFDLAFTNRIAFDARGRIAGWSATPFDDAGKVEALEKAAHRFGLTAAECAFVGDHWNDRHVLRHAGLGIAFRPKHDEVLRAADRVVHDGSLARILEQFPPLDDGAGRG